MEMLPHERGRLSPEDDEEHPERVQAGQYRPDDPDDPEDVAVRPRGQRAGEDGVLGEEAREGRDPDERE